MKLSLPVLKPKGKSPKIKQPRIFSKGNSKLGELLVFNIPAIQTCPGSTESCRSLCYATGFTFQFPNVQDRYQLNWHLSTKARFVSRAVKELNRSKYRIVRWHGSGDFYSKEYLQKVIEICKQTPDKKHYWYTRSWRVEELYLLLVELARLPNVQGWFSCDAESGCPPRVAGVRRAYMQVSAADIPKFKIDLFFRDHALRRTVQKRIAGRLVCPPENGASRNVHCDKCQLCFSDKLDNFRR